MLIKLSPQRKDDTLEVVKDGNKLTVNGEVFDFSPLQDGQSLPASAIQSNWFVDDVLMEDGELTVTLLLPLPHNYSSAQAFPEELVNVKNGVVKLPQPEKEVKE